MARVKKIDLRKIFGGLQEQMISSLATNREVITHPGTQGAATEIHWLKMLTDYLPKRYRVDNAFVLDCDGRISDQIDIVIYDRQYSPFLFNQNGAKYIPAESVYAVFEIKPELNAANIAYAGAKAASVRRLRRTSAAIPHAGGKYKAKKPPEIIAGLLTLDCAWGSGFGKNFQKSIGKLKRSERIDVGCVLRTGGFDIVRRKAGTVERSSSEMALIFFFLRLLARLQSAGTVPALDFDEYSKVL
jgi:hypothetical protein